MCLTAPRRKLRLAMLENLLLIYLLVNDQKVKAVPPFFLRQSNCVNIERGCAANGHTTDGANELDSVNGESECVLVIPG